MATSAGGWQQYVDVNYEIALTIGIANNVDFGAGIDVADAALVINENNANAPVADATTGGADARYGLPQYGRLNSAGNLSWNGVRFPVPGAPNNPSAPPTVCTSRSEIDPTGCFPSVTTVRFTSIRGRAADLGVPDPGVFPTNFVRATLSASSSVPIAFNTNVLNVAVPLVGLIVDADAAEGPNGPARQCFTDSRVVTVNVQEGFATAFKSQGVATFQPGTTQFEAGYFSPGSGVGGSDSGTRIAFSLSGIPQGVAIAVPGSVDNGSPLFTTDAVHLVRVVDTNPDGSGGVLDESATEVEFVFGQALVVYEALDGNPFVTEDVDIPVTISWTADPGNSSPLAGKIKAHVQFAPIGDPQPGQAAPRFLDIEGRSRNEVNLVDLMPCAGMGCMLTAEPPVVAVQGAVAGTLLALRSSETPCYWEPPPSLPSWLSYGPFPVGYWTGTYINNALFALPFNGPVARSATLRFGDVDVRFIQAFTSARFSDVGLESFAFDAANRLRDRGITDGCGGNPPRFCPDDPVTRGQMAVFVIRAIFGNDDFPYPASPLFDDAPATHPFFRWIQKMGELGITNGCGERAYCPQAFVTRGQMAVFLIRMRLGSTAPFDFPALPLFADVNPGHPFYNWIQALRSALITTGCSASDYCPGDLVSRAQMAVFVMRAGFNELLPEGTPSLVAGLKVELLPLSGFTADLTGRNTNFGTGTTIATLDGMTVQSLTVDSATSVRVEIAANAGALPGPRTIRLITGEEQVVLPNAIVVLPAP